jgi:hypothetical protein
MQNHLHLLPRAHRDNALKQWNTFADATREVIQSFPGIESDHPV